MEENKKFKLRDIHPQEKANKFSNLFFIWQVPIFVKYLKNNYTEEYLYKTPIHLQSSELGQLIEDAWEVEVKKFKKNASLWRVLFKLFGVKVFFYGVLYILVDTLTFLGLCASMIKLFQLLEIKRSSKIDNFKSNDLYKWTSYIIILNLIRVYVKDYSFFQMSTLGIKMKIACSSLLYRKILNRQKATLDIGYILNILTTEIHRIIDVPVLGHFLWTAPITTIVTAYFLYAWVDGPSVAGLAFIIPFTIIQYILCNVVYKKRFYTAIQSDKRVRLITELISSIQIIKMYKWEELLSKMVHVARRLELNNLTTISYFKLFYTCTKMFSNRLALGTYILIAILLNYKFDVKNVIVVSLFYDCMRLGVVIYLPYAIFAFNDARVVMSRLKQFLLDETSLDNKRLWSSFQYNNQDSLAIIRNVFYKGPVGIFAKNVSVKWDPDSTQPVLTDVDFLYDSNRLAAIVGASGSGKSTLLHVLLKEIPLERGSVEVHGEVSYASQTPWLFPGSIRQNILFGQEMDKDRYERVVRVCALERDFTLWPERDDTLVGDSGVMMSGGQKARINLARAVYRKADIYLLDDPLSAVDAQVGKHIFNECFMGFLRGRCTILVTHQVHLLKDVKDIYFLRNGRIVTKGNFNNLQKVETKFETLVRVDENYTTNLDVKVVKDLQKISNRNENLIFKKSSTTENYKNYCKAAGGWPATLNLLTFFIVVQIFCTATDYYVVYWATYKTSTVSTFLYINSAVIVALILVTIIRSYVNAKFSTKASDNLHKNMLNNIIYGKIRFFHTNPAGRILNRFTKDIGAIDNNTLSLMDTMQVSLNMLYITGIIVFLNYWTLIPLIPFYIVIYGFAKIFFSISRKIGNAESSAKSPVFSHFATSLQGLSIIRAFGMQNKLIKEFDIHQDNHSSVYYLLMALQFGISFWINMNTIIYHMIVLMGIMYFNSDQPIAYIGLVYNNLISLTLIVSFGIKNLCELNNSMISTGRIIEYTKLPPENNFGKTPVAANWPQNGKIEFEGVSMRYSPEDPLVIKQVTLDIRAREKIGIVGRTGAGKSSLISIIFRLCDFDGKVLIDGIDTKSISLSDLRSKISIIPQDPVLISGTVRKNLDPFDNYDDSSLWNALESVQLKEVIARLPQGLEGAVSQGGSNFSVGQRQLLCLVRAILRNTKILVLDEATANIDLITDDLIQQTIQEKFKECTVLTVAHRLSTVMGSDKILVMSNGRAVEFDHPRQLLQNSNGLFYGFVHQNGTQMAEKLIGMIRK